MAAGRAGSLPILALLFTACAPSSPERPVVNAAEVSIHGTWSDDGKVASFLGIPFAAPPVGPRRWREPEAPIPAPQIEATRFAAACMQGPHMVDWYKKLVADFAGDPESFPVPEFSEDCLYLNVWTPQAAADAKLPVMVWIHGGSHRGGWSYEPNYMGEQLARKGVVVVSIAYRLDVFGFFSHPELDISNFGLLDQVAALRWVQGNVGNFGGDKDNVTVFGESAGAASIGFLLASPQAGGLFAKAIHQSAGYELVNIDTREQFVDEGIALEREVLAGNGESGIDALRDASAKVLLAGAKKIFADYQPDVVVDGASVPDVLRNSLDQGELHAVQLLVGSNADEWLMYLDAKSSDADLQKQADEYAFSERKAILGELERESSVLRKLDRLITAREFVCPSLMLAADARDRGRSAYVYYFDRVRPGAEAAAIGAYHGAEIPYVFNTHDAWLPTADRDIEISLAMMRYWVSFARTGNPNTVGLPEWPLFSARGAETLQIGDTIRAVRHPEA
ncbi:MAG: carboxylesterase family protein, partial [Woeseiaceae bacterium]